MDLNLNSLSVESFNFNEEGLILLKDTIEAVKIAFNKVCTLKSFINEQLILNKKILPQNIKRTDNEEDEAVPSLKEVNGNELEESVNCSNIPFNQNFPKSDDHCTSDDLTAKTELTTELPVIKEDYTETLKVFVSVKYNRITVPKLGQLFEKARFQNFIINSLTNLKNCSIGIISFADKEDVNRAVKLNYKLTLFNRPLLIRPYRKKDDQMNGDSDMGTLNESSAYSLSDTLFPYAVEPKPLDQRNLGEDFGLHSSEADNIIDTSIVSTKALFQTEPSTSNYRNTSKEPLNKIRFPSTQHSMRDNRGLKFNTDSSFGGEQLTDPYSFHNYPQNSNHLKKANADMPNEYNNIIDDNCFKNRDTIPVNNFTTASSSLTSESNNSFYKYNSFTSFSFPNEGNTRLFSNQYEHFPETFPSGSGDSFKTNSATGPWEAGNWSQPRMAVELGSVLTENPIFSNKREPVYNSNEDRSQNSQRNKKSCQRGNSKNKAKKRVVKKKNQNYFNHPDTNRTKADKLSVSIKKDYRRNQKQKQKQKGKIMKILKKQISLLTKQKKNQAQQNENSQNQPAKRITRKHTFWLGNYKDPQHLSK